MRIACVGKGGSGKSSVSWLLANMIAEKYNYVCAIDADHNMDLTSLFKYTFTEKTETFHRFHDEFRAMVDQKTDRAWQNIVLDGRSLPKFQLRPESDSYTKKIKHKIDEMRDLMIVGLGADDVLYSGRCAHGHSAPLKYYLALLDARDSYVVVDGVAGSDMLNAGVYVAVDFLSIIVEPQPNSIRVAKQLRNIAEQLEIPFCVIVNKVVQNEFLDEIKEEFGNAIVGYIPIDSTIMFADFLQISSEVKKSLLDILDIFSDRFSYSDTLPRLKNFESERVKNNI